MYPHERSLVKKYEGKPFVILGINSDKDPRQLQKVLAKEQITWRSWFDNGTTRGPIATKWNVRGWPTLFLVDHKGIIREKSLGAAQWDDTLEKLVREAEGKSATQAPAKP
jgi:hypothetical protein